MTTKLYVGGIPYTTTNDDLKNHFSPAGAVVSAQIIIDKMTNRSKGFGFVTFSTEEEAKLAIEGMNNNVFDGRRIGVKEAIDRA